jgi:hypothetical protein
MSSNLCAIARFARSVFLPDVNLGFRFAGFGKVKPIIDQSLTKLVGHSNPGERKWKDLYEDVLRERLPGNLAADAFQLSWFSSLSSGCLAMFIAESRIQNTEDRRQ